MWPGYKLWGALREVTTRVEKGSGLILGQQWGSQGWVQLREEALAQGSLKVTHMSRISLLNDPCLKGEPAVARRNRQKLGRASGPRQTGLVSCQISGWKEIDVLRRKRRQKQDRKIPGSAELIEPRLQGISISPWPPGGQELTRTGPMGTKGLPCRARDMVHLGIWNPLDQCCAIECSVKILKMVSHVELLNTWNMLRRTEELDLELYLTLIHFKWPHGASGYCIE